MQQVQITLPIDSIVNERYQVENLLGRGGFGAVYLVRDLRVRQNVFALKEIVDPDQRERRHFTFEADLLKRTDHPSLPRIYRTFDNPVQGRAYMLMDYIEGPNLEKLRRQQPEQRFSLAETLRLMGPVVEAVIYLHAQQPPIIHRDIKPSNMIVPDSGDRTMLVDFGIAKEFDQEATTTAIRHATPGYGAPEQYGTGTDMHTDIYGLGATLYTLLTGTAPIDAFFRMTQEMSKKHDPLTPVKQLIPEIPEHVSAAIARAMALDKSLRFATVEEFWAALQPEAQGYPVTDAATEAEARPDVPPVENTFSPTPAVKVYRPNPGLVATSSPSRGRWLAMVLLITLALGIGFAAAFYSIFSAQQQQTSARTPVAAYTPGITPRPSQQPAATPTPRTQPTVPRNLIPTLASGYAGTIDNTNVNSAATMSLTGITQNGQNIQGTFLVGQPLSGNGPFTGTVGANSSIQFTVHSTDSNVIAPLFFSGLIGQNGSLSGQYCSLNAAGNCDSTVGGHGTWSVQPDNSST